MLRAFVLIAAVLGAVSAVAQNCGSHAPDADPAPIATDRPQVTSSSIVVPCGSLQFENGFAETGNAGRQTSGRTYDLSETSIRLGVLSKTELRFGIPNYFWNAQTTAGFATGLGDLSLGFKQQLGPIHGLDLSLIPTVSLPTGANAISSHGYDPSFQLPWSYALSKTWTGAGMFSLAWPTQQARRNLTGQASVYLDRQFTAPLDGYFEYSGAFPRRGGPQHQIDFGAAYKLSPHQQLDLHCGFGLSAALPGHTIGVGYSVRFGPRAYARPQPGKPGSP